jgi:hypothetical protein
MSAPLTAERLRQVLHYNEVTGVWTWLISRGRIRAGSVAGHVPSDGYRRIRIDGQTYISSRLAWLYTNGVWPPDLIDHRDCARDNDQINNLRQASWSQNMSNRPGWSRRGFPKGVRASKTNTGFEASIYNGKRTHLGTFPTIEAARGAYAKAAVAAWGEFARTA